MNTNMCAGAHLQGQLLKQACPLAKKHCSQLTQLGVWGMLNAFQELRDQLSLRSLIQCIKPL